MAYATIRLRRGTPAEWAATNPILKEGEIVVETPSTGVGTGLCRFKIGDGHTPYKKLPYAFDAEVATSIYGGNAYDFHNIWIRSSTNEEWKVINPILGKGEITYDSTENRLKIGDGESRWEDLPYVTAPMDMGEDPNDFDFGDMDEYYNAQSQP